MQSPPDKRRIAWICFALAALTLAVYAPALRCQFLTFDDQAYVTENRHVRAGLTLAGVEWAFRSTTAGNWHPLTMLSHMLDCQVYGMRAWGHHLTSILLHTVNTVLLFLLLAQMTGKTWRSACVAALFGVHPVHVESVVWIAERKDVLCGFFFLLAIWAYWKQTTAESAPNRRFWSFAVLILFAFALMSKPMAVTLPFVLLALDFWPLERTRKVSWSRLILEKIPLMLLTVVFCGITVWAQKKGDAVASDSILPLSERVVHAMISYFDYIRVLVFPWHLSVYYPYEHHEPAIMGIAAAAGLALITGIALATSARRSYLTVGWVWFIGMLVPVIGLVQVGGQGWADRYLYLPCIGFFIAVIWTGAELAARISVVKLLFPAAIVALVAVTFSEFPYWRDTTTLFTRALDVTRGNYLAMTLVGSMDADKGQLEDAIQLYRNALAIKPTYPEAHFFLGRALERKGQMNDALAEYNRALRLRPEFDAANVMVGLALARENKFDEAIAHYRVALKTNPESAAAQSDWGNALMKQGRWPESVAHYEAALRLDDSLAEAHNNLGIGYMQAGRVADGVAQLRAALKLNPTDAETKYNLGQALNQEQKWNEAYEVLSLLATEAPSDFNTQFQCGVALEHLGQTRDAMSHYAAALLKNPDFPEALQHLAWIAATDARAEFRNGEQAVELASRACELTGQQRPSMLLTLAAAYGEVGKFDNALTTLDKVTALAKTQHQEQLVTQAEQMRKLFQRGKPFRGWEESK